MSDTIAATIQRAREHSIGDLLRRSAKRYPGKTALICGEVSWTFAEMDAICNRLGRGLLGLGIALLLRRPTRFHNAVSIMLLLPLMTAPAIAALMWKLMTNPSFGILSYLVGLFGVTDFKWASDPSSALFTVVLVDVWVYTPFIMILLLAGLRSLPRQPFEAAALDGVPASFVFFRITLPMLAPYIITASLFRLLDSIQQFDIIYAMTQGGPGDRLMVFQVQAYLEFFQYTNVGRSAALLMILWLITNILSNIFIKNWLRLRARAHGHA